MIVPAMLLASLPAGAQPKAGAPSEQEIKAKAKAQARTYLLAGNKEAAAGRWDDAYAEHTIAWQLHQDWETAGALGKSAHRTGHHSVAIRRLTEYLATAPRGRISAKERASIEQWIATSRGQVGYLTITAPAGAEVTIDGESQGKAPLAGPVPADPGPHEIQAQIGAAARKSAVTVVAGKTHAVTITSEEEDAAARRSSALRVAGLAGGGALTLGGIVVGGVFTGLAAERGAEKQRASEDTGGRATMQEAARAEAEAKNIAFWGFAGAAIAAAGTTTFYVKTRRSGQAPVTAAAGVRAGGPFVWVQGEF